MAKKYSLPVVPDKGEIVFCDFTPFAAPEMVKRRPCIVISPRMNSRPSICTIVPLSTTAPSPIEGYHCEISLNPLLRAPFDNPKAWAKCDMLYTVSITRLDRPYRFDINSHRCYYKQILDPSEMKVLEKAVLCGLGIQPEYIYL